MQDESSHARRYSARYSATKASLIRARSTPTFSGCGKSWKGTLTIQYTFARCVAQATSLCHSPEVGIPAGVLASLVTLCGNSSKPLLVCTQGNLYHPSNPTVLRAPQPFSQWQLSHIPISLK